MPKIIFCQATYKADLEDTLKCIERVSPHVDATVIAFDQSLTMDEMLDAVEPFDDFHVYLVQFEWKDNMPEMRNAYLHKAKELKADWVVVSDPDELYSEALAKNLKEIIADYDRQGANLIAVPCVDQFENVEWLDEHDLMKETPGGYRETDFWKPLLIFKVYEDTQYIGVGIEKNVHEQLAGTTPIKSARLPKEYHYVHKKSALRIWRNAARNMYIGGGGDNVGEVNPYWMRLKTLLAEENVHSWPQFEAYVEEGTDSPAFHEWLDEALSAPPTNWGTETREMAKWYFTLHRDQVTQRLEEKIKSPPEMTGDIELENYIVRTYFQILGRHPDEEGKTHYMRQIKAGVMQREMLAHILMQSPEYQARVGKKQVGVRESIRIPIPVRVDIQLDAPIFIQALQMSKTWWEIIKPKMDVGGFILEGLTAGDTKFIEWFYENRNDIGIQDLTEYLLTHQPAKDSLAVVIMGYHAGMDLIMQSIEVTQTVCTELHIIGDDFTEEDIEIIEGYGGVVHEEPWEDEFSDYKNKALSYARTEWVLILDHDEIPTEEMAKVLPELIEKSNHGALYNIMAFDVIDQDTKDGEVVDERVSTGGKPLLHWNVRDPYYGNPHIWLKQGYYAWNHVKAPYAYRHVKEVGTELPRSVRNVYLGGGGDNTREKNPLWLDLRVVCTDLLIKSWAEFNETLKKGDIPIELLEVLRELDEMEWKDDELKDPLKYYYQMHPDEKDRYE